MKIETQRYTSYTGAQTEYKTRSLGVRVFTKINTGLVRSSGLLWVVILLLLIRLRLVAVGVVVEQGDGRDLTPAHQPGRSDGCAELNDTGGSAMSLH